MRIVCIKPVLAKTMAVGRLHFSTSSGEGRGGERPRLCPKRAINPGKVYIGGDGSPIAGEPGESTVGQGGDQTDKGTILKKMN